MAGSASRSLVSRNLFLLSLASLFNDFATDMAFPLLPAFLAMLGAGALAIGFMEGFADSIASFLRYYSGRWSDQLGRRKPLTIAGYTLSALAKLGYVLAPAAWVVVLVRASDRVGKGTREAPRDALLSESIRPAMWGAAFGFHRTMDAIGSLVGPLLTLVLLDRLGDSEGALREIFLYAALPGIAVIFCLSLLRETEARAPEAAAPVYARESLRVRGPLARFLLAVALFTFGNIGILFLLLRANELGFDLRAQIFLYVLYNAGEVAFALPMGALTDRIGRAPVIAGSFLVFTVLYGLLGVLEPSHWWELVPFFLLMGLGRALREGQGRALVADLSPAAARGTAFGVYHAVIGFVALPGGLLAGALWEIDHRIALVVAQVCTGAALLLFTFDWLGGRLAGRKDDPREDQGRAEVNEAA